MAEVEKCPKCGGEMKKGFLIAPRPLWWDTNKHKWTVGGEQLLPRSLYCTNLEAYRCEKCNLIVFQYTKSD